MINAVQYFIVTVVFICRRKLVEASWNKAVIRILSNSLIFMLRIQEMKEVLSLKN